MAEHDATLSLLGLLTNADLFKQRLAEHAKAKSDAEAAAAKAEQAKAEAQEFVRLAEATKQTQTSQIAAAKDEHDRAAKEAADRIALGNRQAEELLKIKTENETLAQTLADKEAVLAQRESKVAAVERHHGDWEARLDAKEQELDARAERMRQAAA